jgi:hypothetical protein
MAEPVYQIRNKAGEVLIQGTASQVAIWVREKRVTEAHEFQREGWQLYEQDLAWGTLEAFPELSGPTGWARLKQLKRCNLWLLVAGLSLTLAGLAVIAWSHWLPAYDASQRIAASKSAETAALHNAETAAERAAIDRRKAFSAEVKCEEAVQRSERLSAEVIVLKDSLDKLQKTMPVVIRWRESLLNSKRVLIVVNTSDQPLRLLVSVYDINGRQTKQQYPLNLDPVSKPGFVQESGVGEYVKHYFSAGESVELTDVDNSRSFRYSPKKVKCE